MNYELELKNEQLENMIHVYEEHIDCLLYTSDAADDL